MAARPIAPLTGRSAQDLGFGPVVSDATRRRFLNRDGTFNVKRTGLGFAESRSFYRYLLDISWPRFIVHVASLVSGDQRDLCARLSGVRC